MKNDTFKTPDKIGVDSLQTPLYREKIKGVSQEIEQFIKDKSPSELYKEFFGVLPSGIVESKNRGSGLTIYLSEEDMKRATYISNLKISGLENNESDYQQFKKQKFFGASIKPFNLPFPLVLMQSVDSEFPISFSREIERHEYVHVRQCLLNSISLPTHAWKLELNTDQTLNYNLTKSRLMSSMIGGLNEIANEIMAYSEQGLSKAQITSVFTSDSGNIYKGILWQGCEKSIPEWIETQPENIQNQLLQIWNEVSNDEYYNIINKAISALFTFKNKNLKYNEFKINNLLMTAIDGNPVPLVDWGDFLSKKL